jgi:cell division protein FtsB
MVEPTTPRTPAPKVAGGRSTNAATGARSTDPRRPARRANLTGRAAVLALVVCALAISLAYPLREWLAQRREIASAQSQVARQESRVQALRDQQRRWADPAYVKAQARERLHFVLPGETSYVVLDPHEAPGPKASAATVARTGPDPSRPWFTQLWQSAQAADKK